MRKTLTITLSSGASAYLESQEEALGTLDPSALVNQLLREDMARQNWVSTKNPKSPDSNNPQKRQNAKSNVRSAADEQSEEQLLEDHLDEDIPAAG